MRSRARTCARPGCHEEFESWGRRRYCSDECKAEAHRAQAREWHRDNAEEISERRRSKAAGDRRMGRGSSLPYRPDDDDDDQDDGEVAPLDTRPPSMRVQDAERNLTYRLAPPRAMVHFAPPASPEFYRRRPDRGEHVLANPAAGGMAVVPSSAMRRVMRPQVPSRFGPNAESAGPIQSGQLASSVPSLEKAEEHVQAERQVVSEHNRALGWTHRG